LIRPGRKEALMLSVQRGSLAMMSAMVVFACSLLAPHPALAQGKDIAGWTDTKWGMGVAELLRLHPEITIGKDFLGGTAGTIPVKIGELSFTAYLTFDNVGSNREKSDKSPEPPQSEWKLATVELYLKSADADQACRVISMTLTGKYGEPTKMMGESGLPPVLWTLR
jgi:hypothetical protein